MKKLLLIFALSLVALGVRAQETRREERMELKHERAERREERQKEYARYLDSLILSRDYEFVPQTFQMQPAGMLRNIYNPFYYIYVYPSYIQIHVPYIKGFTPPYYIALLNFDSFYPNGYTAVQGEHGWTISFSASGMDGNTYTFDFFVYYVGGETNLNISTPVYNTVTYSGYLRGYN